MRQGAKVMQLDNAVGQPSAPARRGPNGLAFSSTQAFIPLTRASRLTKSIYKARMPKSRLRSAAGWSGVASGMVRDLFAGGHTGRRGGAGSTVGSEDEYTARPASYREKTADRTAGMLDGRHAQ